LEGLLALGDVVADHRLVIGDHLLDDLVVHAGRRDGDLGRVVLGGLEAVLRAELGDQHLALQRLAQLVGELAQLDLLGQLEQR
jgi:hypothetical protein